jgi:hypothetical protein
VESHPAREPSAEAFEMCRFDWGKGRMPGGNRSRALRPSVLSRIGPMSG